ncbi:MAG TPA: PrsW family glutamic-type intramembrane protease [Streptosporangiaceae bacterium]|jgi:RsiW-degrading membrane proteinase PrsW (M82 family)
MRKGATVNELEVTFEGRRYSFEPGKVVTIGRSSDSDVVVSDPTVSRQHIRLAWGQHGWIFETLGRSGTFAGGQPVGRLMVTGPMQLSLASPQGPVVGIEPVYVPDPQATRSDQSARPVPPAADPMAADPMAAASPVAAGAAGAVQGPAGTSQLPGGAAPPPGQHRATGQGAGDELATAFQILVPVKSWLTDPGWRQGIRLLVIPYALLPLVFLALFGTSSNLSTPGWAYSLYVAPLWAIAFWLLIRPGQVGRLEGLTGAGIVAFVLLWMSIVTINVNNHLNPRNLGDAIAVGYNEELAKALPILLAALLLLRWWQVKLDVRMWMFLGTIAGLAFGVREASLYTTLAIEHIATAAVNHSANLAVVGALSFAFRVFVDGFQHAIWAGVSAFFIGMAVNYPRRRVQLIVFGVSIAAVLHALNDWLVSNIASLWPWILLQALSLVLFLGYSMSATSIERNVRRTPLFRGDSILMEKFTDPGS